MKYGLINLMIIFTGIFIKLNNRILEFENMFTNANGVLKRALNQSSRELLAQSSDWAFIMSTGTMVEYAEKHIKGH